MDREEKKSTAGCCQDMMSKHHGHHNYSNHGGGNAIYCLGVIGALFYFLNGATTFVAVMMGIGKAVFWPAILMFKLLTYLQI